MSASIPSVRPDAQFVDEHDERLPLARAAYRDRADERMPGVEIRITRRELAPVGAVEVWRLESPPGIERRKPHGIARLDRQHGRKFDREVPVQRGPLEWEVVDHERRRHPAEYDRPPGDSCPPRHQPPGRPG